MKTMMPLIMIDDRVGSVGLAPFFKNPVESARMEFGDFAFMGNGPDDCPMMIGIERKTVRDLLTSMDSGRLFGHQVPGMLRSYSRNYLIVERYHQYRPGIDGVLEELHGNRYEPLELGRRYMWKEISGVILSLEEARLDDRAASFRVKYSKDQAGTAGMVERIAAWWGKDWEDHKAAKTIYCGAGMDGGREDGGGMVIAPASFMERVAMQLPGVGIKKARRVAQRFKTVVEMALAGSEAWEEIEGIGGGMGRKLSGLMIDGERGK